MPRFPFTGLDQIEAFAVDDTSAQITVRGSEGAVSVRVGAEQRELEPFQGAITTTVNGLAPDAHNPVHVEVAAERRTLSLMTRQSVGTVRTRFATISDVHLGLEGFGLVKRLHDDGEVPYALRCAQAAIDEAIDWGAELLIVKGDLTEKGSIEQWNLAAELLGNVDIPVMITVGNHDDSSKAEISPADAIRDLGYDDASVQIRDLHGVRIVVGDTSLSGRGRGSIRPIADDLHAATDTEQPVFLAIHHNIQRVPIPWFWPPGIPSTDAQPFIARLGELNENVLISSGHTHRNRRHRLGPTGRILATEVASTSDYPGVWAGYEVSDTMIRQSVRRITRPDVHSWCERTRRAVGGLWPRWSQGRLDDRCVDLVFR